MGEIQFIRHVPVVAGHLVLYHGITTFLRVGDVSLISLDGTRRVAAIGELKTRPDHEDEMLNISLLLHGPRSNRP